MKKKKKKKNNVFWKLDQGGLASRVMGAFCPETHGDHAEQGGGGGGQIGANKACIYEKGLQNKTKDLVGVPLLSRRASPAYLRRGRKK